LRQKYDAILVGAGTWIKDHPKLDVRDCAEPHRRNPVILVHDPKKRLSKDQMNPSVHLFHQKEMCDLIQAVESHDFGFELQSVFCEGGARSLNQLFEAGRVDLVHRFIGQKDFGAHGPSSPHRVSGFSPETSNAWECATLCEFGNDLLQEWVKCS
jgi:riboflavin biosynthesis pyrimidine reductase